MNLKILLPLALLLLVIGTADAYELCDSIERDSNAGFFRCNITETKYRFSQQDIDGFWENLQKDGDYMHDRLSVVEWNIKGTVIEVSDDLHFIQPKGMDLAWDISLKADANTIHDINQAAATGPRPANQTAIKKRMGAMQEYFISFAPLGGRRSVRNITMEKPVGALAVYISGSNVKKMVMDLEGNLSLSSAYIKNIESLKAKNIDLNDAAYLSRVNYIEAENLLLDSQGYIRNAGRFGETAIKLNGSIGLSLKNSSLIENLVGGIEVEADVLLENESRIENVQYVQSEAIQWIYAENMSLTEESKVMGVGGSPGEIILTGALSMDNSQIVGKGENKPDRLTAKSISLSNNSQLLNFSKSINVTGKETFVLESGSIIKEFGGTINSCAKLLMDANTVISFSADGEKTIKANSLDLNSNAKITCIGEKDCNYTFVQQSCDVAPSAVLDVEGEATGIAPFTVKFAGECDGRGMPVTCTIDFGDGSAREQFDGNAVHTYEMSGGFIAILTAESGGELKATSEKNIAVLEQGMGPALGPVKLGLSKQLIEKGGEISLLIECEEELQTFLLENDLGLPTVTDVPEKCPVTLGPFKVPEGIEPGVHYFKASGTTSDGSSYSQTASFTVKGAEPIFPGIPFDLENYLPYISAGALVLVGILVLVVLLVKKKRVRGLKKPKAAEEVGEKPAGQKPPWMVEDEEEEAIAPKPEEKPAKPKEEKLAGVEELKPAMTKEEKLAVVEELKPAMTKEEKPAELKPAMTKEEKPVGTKEEKPAPPVAGTARPVEGMWKPRRVEGKGLAEKGQSSEKFRKLVEALKRPKPLLAETGEEKGMPTEWPGKMPAGEREKPAILKEEKPAATETARKPAKIDWDALERELAGKAAAGEKPTALHLEKPAEKKKATSLHEAEKPAEKKSPVGLAAKKVAAKPSGEEPAVKPEKRARRGFSFLKRKKKPEEKDETAQPKKKKLPPWLMKG